MKKGQSAFKVHCYRDANKFWRWRVVGRNGKTLADSGEAYNRKGPMDETLTVLFQGKFEIVIDTEKGG